MQKIVECVPNFSEGKDKKIIDAIFNAALRQTQGKPVKVFELESNSDHNRMLFTIVGEPEDVLTSVFESIKVATRLIDMNKHNGEHPRIGATDVVPFVPVSGVTMKESVELANKLGKKVGRELGIPVFLYEEAATKPENRNLADVRKGEYEGLRVKMSSRGGSALGGNKPDFGPDKLHPTAGAVVIGARKYLVAFNVNLDTPNVQIAKQIASKIREKNGGLTAVKALGFEVDGLAQVSMNLVDFEKTNFDQAYRAIEKEIKNYKVGIKSSEIYGMIPLEAIVRAIKTTFMAEKFNPDQLLEKRLYE